MPPPFHLNSLKGRLAEQLVQDLFIMNGYNVFNYGLERLHPGLSKSLKINNGNTSKALRFMPDFVVQSARDGQLFYLEVKFRADGFFEFDEKYKGYPYKNAWFVIVSPQKIQCMHYKGLKQGLFLSNDGNNRLNKGKYFHIDKDSLEEYEKYAAQLFGAFKSN